MSSHIKPSRLLPSRLRGVSSANRGATLATTLAMSSLTFAALISAALMLTAASPLTARANDDDHDEEIFTATNPLWKDECGACHIAYPPALLPAESWRALMAGLDDHFGTDASLDAEATVSITAFLERNAGRQSNAERRVGDRRGAGRAAADAGPILRITETRWFLDEHDDVPPRIWTRPDVQRGVNCEACHRQAASGDFGDQTRELPR